ncbi:hypothetical protein FALCPG4_015618 [Fusarium falciforme]
MSTFIEFVDRLVYGTGSAAVITPNHRDWTNSPGGGLEWIDHMIEDSPNSMLAAFEKWLQDNNLPPLIPWDGVNWASFDGQDNVNQQRFGLTLPPGLDGTFTGISDLAALGRAFSNHYIISSWK